MLAAAWRRQGVGSVLPEVWEEWGLLIRKHCLIEKVYGARQGVSLGQTAKATHESFETKLDKELKEK